MVPVKTVVQKEQQNIEQPFYNSPAPTQRIFKEVWKLLIYSILGFSAMALLSSLNGHLYIRELTFSFFILLMLQTLRIFSAHKESEKTPY